MFRINKKRADILKKYLGYYPPELKFIQRFEVDYFKSMMGYCYYLGFEFKDKDDKDWWKTEIKSMFELGV